MNDDFFAKPILNSPYEYPSRHWELDDQGQPTRRVLETRRVAKFVTPIPKPRKRKGGEQAHLVYGEGKEISTAERRGRFLQALAPTSLRV